MSPGRWLRSLAALIGAAALVAGAAGPVRAAYQASADSNTTAFSFNCINVQVSPSCGLPTGGSEADLMQVAGMVERRLVAAL